MELPPRTRRILDTYTFAYAIIGTTSAHAENTTKQVGDGVGGWNYLRARGEYTGDSTLAPAGMELPPRTRRIHTNMVDRLEQKGTTSAHAENTPLEGAPYVWGGNYLRARGEYPK